MVLNGFFKKLGKETSTAFKKAGSGLNYGFKKGGAIEKGLGKIGGVAKQIGSYASKAGGVLSDVAPVLMGVPGIGPELALGAGALGKFSQKVGGLLNKGGKSLQDTRKLTTLEKPQLSKNTDEEAFNFE